MWDLAVREADFGAADSMLRRYHGSAPLSYRVLSAFARGDSVARAGVLDEARAADNRQPQIAARFIATYLEDLGTAAQFARLSLAAERRPTLRAGAQQLLAWLEVARGRWSAAKTGFATAGRLEGVAPPVGVSWALAATLPFLAVSRADLSEIRRETERWDAAAEAPEANAGLTRALARHLRLYLLGLLRSGLGDEVGASQAAAELEQLPTPLEASDAIHALAQTVRADLAWRRGRAADALTTLESVRGAVPLELVNVPLYATVREYAQEHARFLRGELLYLLGRDAEALRWLETSFQGAPNEFVYRAPLHLLQGKIYERLGDRTKAAQHYDRFLNLWKDCDPELWPKVQEARARLAALRGGSRQP